MEKNGYLSLHSEGYYLGFKLQNFVTNRTSITARSTITATFDNFKINAAEEIVEEDI